MLAFSRALVTSTWSALSVSANSNTVTCLTIPAKSSAASIPELPPPTTATSLPLKKGPSQCGQYATPLPTFSASPFTPIFRHFAPVANMILRVTTVSPVFSVIW